MIERSKVWIQSHSVYAALKFEQSELKAGLLGLKNSWKQTSKMGR